MRTSFARRSRSSRVILASTLTAAAALLPGLAGCGKDKTDFEALKGQVGVVPGDFNVRLGQSYRDKIDALQAKLDGLVPGISSQLTQRFAGAGDADKVDAKGTKLSDLLKIKLPGSDSDFVNQNIFSQLTKLAGEAGPYFDVVDTGKFLKGPSTYEPAGGGQADPNIGDQYYLDMIKWRQGLAGVDAAQLAKAVPVVVAVLDTGVSADHEDLTNVMWQSTDPQYAGAVGFDANSGKALAKSESVDPHGHGTHVAGLIGGQGDNGKGIHGVAYLPGQVGTTGKAITEIMNIRVLNDNGAGTSDEVATGLKWAVNQYWKQKEDSKTPERKNQKMVVNMSLGGPFEVNGYEYKRDADGTPILEDDLINYATARDDVLIVVAAGNESCGIGGGCDLLGEHYKETYYYPCSYDNVLCVAATTHEDELAGFSNRKASVGIAAPGWQILSTLPPDKGSYGYYSGTSQATPVTAGAAAVVWSLYPGFKASEIKAILRKSSAQIADITSQIKSGDGRLDLNAALAYAKALSAANASPATTEPAVGLVSIDKVQPAKAPQSDQDPNAPSKDAVANAPADKGKGSAQGCAVLGGGAAAAAGDCTGLLLALGLLLPLAFVRPKRM